jgi:small GTP-binding protein
MGFIKKVCLLGDPAVGKTSLIARYVHDMFDEKYLATIGTKPSVRTVDVGGASIDLTIWDIAGQEDFQNVHNSYFRGAQGAILVCDVTRPETADALPHWERRFAAVAPKAPIVLVSNKWDLVGANSVPSAEGLLLEMSKAKNLQHFRASAKDGSNVGSIFQTLARAMVEK